MNKQFTYAPPPFKKMPKKIRKLAVANAIYVPDTDKLGNKISKKQFHLRIQETENYLLKIFGGFATSVLEHGEFKSIRKKIICENVVHVMSFSEVKTFLKHRKSLEKWLLQKKKEWNQEALGYEFEGDLYFI